MKVFFKEWKHIWSVCWRCAIFVDNSIKSCQTLGVPCKDYVAHDVGLWDTFLSIELLQVCYHIHRNIINMYFNVNLREVERWNIQYKNYVILFWLSLHFITVEGSLENKPYWMEWPPQWAYSKPGIIWTPCCFHLLHDMSIQVLQASVSSN